MHGWKWRGERLCVWNVCDMWNACVRRVRACVCVACVCAAGACEGSTAARPASGCPEGAADSEYGGCLSSARVACACNVRITCACSVRVWRARVRKPCSIHTISTHVFKLLDHRVRLVSTSCQHWTSNEIENTKQRMQSCRESKRLQCLFEPCNRCSDAPRAREREQ